MGFMSVLYHHQSDLWPENHKVSFDGPNKLIYVNDGVTSLDVQVELYSDMKEWMQLRDWNKYEVPMRTIGGDPTTGGGFAGDLYFMTNGWRVVYDPRVVRITGVLFSDDYESAWLNKEDLQPVFPAVVANLALKGAVDVTGTGLSTEQNTKLVDIFTYLGLDPTKPLITKTSSITVGASITQTITGDPEASVTVTRT